MEKQTWTKQLKVLGNLKKHMLCRIRVVIKKYITLKESRGMENIRVLHVTGAMNIGGTESMLMNIYRAVDRSRLQFDFLTFTRREAYFDEEIRSLGGKILVADNGSSFNQIYFLIKKGKYKAVHAHTLFNSGIVMAAAKAAGVPVRISHAHTTADNINSFKKRVYVWTMQKLINQCSNAYLTCSREAGKFLYGHDKAEWLPNIIAVNNYLRKDEKVINEFKVKYGLERKLVIGHVGRFIEAKNHAFLLEILSEMKTVGIDVVLLLVGDGDLKKQLENEAEKLKLSSNVIFTGALRDTGTALHAMDVFIFPSKYEGLGLVLLEAQAAGVPCITSEFIQPEADAGLGLVQQLSLKQNKDVWIKAVQNAAVNGKHKNAAEREKKLLEKGYSIEKITKRIAELYEI
jgi:glycosyltransferase involved in cell wall biosynthesis